MKMKQRMLISLLFGLAISILGGLSGLLACKVVLKIGCDVVWWDTHVQGNPPLADTPEGILDKEKPFSARQSRSDVTGCGQRNLTSRMVLRISKR
jgi:hypothetical protein